MTPAYLGVAEQHGTGNLGAHIRGDVPDGRRAKSAALAVTTCHDGRLGALLGGLLEETNHLGDGGGAGAVRQHVVGDAGSVCSANALDPDAAEFGLEGRADNTAEDALGALARFLVDGGGATHEVAALAGGAGIDEDYLRTGAAVLDVVTSVASSELAGCKRGLRGLAGRQGGNQASGKGEKGDAVHLGCLEEMDKKKGITGKREPRGRSERMEADEGAWPEERSNSSGEHDAFICFCKLLLTQFPCPNRPAEN